MSKLAIVIVSWNTRGLLRRCVESIHASLAQAAVDYRVVVVDNASADGTPAMLRAEHPEVLLLEAGGNLGFAGGNNLALRRVLSDCCRVANSEDQAHSSPVTSHSSPDYVMLLNPDTEALGDAIPRLL